MVFFVQFVVKFTTKTHLFFGRHFKYLEDPGVYIYIYLLAIVILHINIPIDLGSPLFHHHGTHILSNSPLLR